MIRGLLIGALAIGLAGTAYWGYSEHVKKNNVVIRTENNYQRAFHELTYEVDLLHDKIGDTLAMKSQASISPALVEVWGLTSQAHSNVGQLPLRYVPINKTEEFLTNVGNFSYRTAVRNLDKEPLNEKEYATLQKLYKNSAEIQGVLRKVQHEVFKKNLRWTDVEVAYASNKQPSHNRIIDGFTNVEKTANAYTDPNLDPSTTDFKVERKDFSNIKGKKITEEQAKAIATNFLDLNGSEKIKVIKSGGKLKDQYYSLTINQPKSKTDIYMDITEKGGYPVWVLNSRGIGSQKVDLNAASQNGLKFLDKNKFKNMELYESSQYDNVGVFSYVTNVNGIRIYPETINIKIALDNGGIVGFSAKNYLLAFTNRTIPTPKLTAAEARNNVNPNLKIMEERKAIILNKMNKEVLCYEFLGTISNDTYQIFINADTGIEEQIKKLDTVEELYQ